MAEQTNAQTPDVMQLWRDWLTETERQFNSFFADAMNQDAAARGVGGYVEMNAGFQRMMADFMQRYLAFMNMPSRTDVVGVAETLSAIEERLSRIEETLRVVLTASDASEPPASRTAEPARSSQPDPDTSELPTFRTGVPARTPQADASALPTFRPSEPARTRQPATSAQPAPPILTICWS